MQWIKCSDRLPTEADGDGVGNVFVRSAVPYNSEPYTTFFFVLYWKYITTKHHYEWLAGACERTEVVFNQKEESK
jgi:hypothetical protein